MTEQESCSRPGRPKDAAKREDIVAAATALFLEKGFALTSMEAVARRAGVSKLTIYSHFTDKNELFRAIMQDRCERHAMPDSFVAMADQQPEEALLTIAHRALSIVFREDSLRMQRILYAEAARHPKIIEIFYQSGPGRIKIAFADLLRAFDRQGKLSVADPEQATEQFFSLLKGERLLRTLMFVLPPPDEKEIDARASAGVDVFLSAYRPQHTTTSKTK
ncbi:MAG: TetR/AcrR family transcriptional regulator [Alphaproteobacteria bacterium]|nr:TetR/AcrR family transcriptional regulator [Alphaproteobacteria bacterium]